MDFTRYETSACSIWRTAMLLGDRWTVIVVRDLLNGVRRFDELADHLGVARDVLTKRLTTLVEAGIAEKREYREPGRRARFEYVPTDAGVALRPMLMAMMDFGDRFLAGDDGPPMAALHASSPDGECGERVHARLVCAAGHVISRDDRMALAPRSGAVLR